MQNDKGNVEKIEEIPKGRRRGKDNETRGGPPRDPKTANYLPDPQAEGAAHINIGVIQAEYGARPKGYKKIKAIPISRQEVALFLFRQETALDSFKFHMSLILLGP